MKRCDGNIQLITLILIILISAFVGVAVNSTLSTARITDRSRQYASIQAAAEGAVEYAFGIWKTRTVNAVTYLPSSGLSITTPPAFSGLTYTSNLAITPLDQYGAPVATPVGVMTDVPTYNGWRGQTYSYLASAKLKGNVGTLPIQVGIKRYFAYTAVPLFQSMYFFQDDLVFYKPAQMIVGGLVHTNGNAYLSGQSGASLTFTGDVSYSDSYSSTIDPPYANMWSGYSANAEVSPVYSSGGVNAQLSQVNSMEPLGVSISSAINTTDSNPNNDSLHELIEPANTSYTDPTAFANRRIYNKAGMIISINGTAVTVTGKNGTSVTSTQQTAIKAAITKVQSALYDQREGTYVDVNNVDISALRTVLNAGISGFNNIVYIYDVTAQTTADPQPKTIRLQNGGQLPDNGLTIASQNPVYIQGDYNTGTTTNPAAVPANVSNTDNSASPTTSSYTRKPAAVMADAVMFLSNSWNDSNSSKSISYRTASDTTYNTAILSGFIPSGYTPGSSDPHYGAAQYGYSGGANNFPRYLENWTDQYCTYYGSMVELYQSKTFTGEWDTGNIFSPPLRRFNYDLNFGTNPPAGSLDAVTWGRGAWTKF